VAEADDGDCTTAVGCVNCEKNVIKAFEHRFSTESGKCERCEVRAVATVTVGGEATSYLTFLDALDAVVLSSAESEGVLKLHCDVELNKSYSAKGYFTLDLNGKTLKSTAGSGSSFMILATDGYMRITDTAGGGKIIGGQGMILRNNTTFKMDSGSMILSGSTALSVGNDSTVVIEGTAYIEANMYGISSGSGCSVYVSGGTIKSGTIAVNYSKPKAVIISGGTFYVKFYDNMSGGSAVQPVFTGGAFPEGINVDTPAANLVELIGEGYAFYVSGEEVTVDVGATKLSGDVTIMKKAN
jgi:hypothetical protein